MSNAPIRVIFQNSVTFTDCFKPPSLLRTVHLNKLLGKAHELLHTGLAKSSRKTYAAGKRRYFNFCKLVGKKLIPTTECTLTLFVTHLATSNTSLRTIKVYLAAVRHMHVCKGLHKQFNYQVTPRLHLILRGIKKRQAGRRFTKPRLPITIPIPRSIKTPLSKEASSYDSTTFWAMCCLAFFGFLRVSEFTIPAENSYDSSCHLSLGDIAVDNRTKSRLLQLFLKQSKTDPYKQGTKVYMGTTDSTVCPVKAVLSYLQKRSTQPGPLFVTEKEKGWTRSTFCARLKSVLHKRKLDNNCYNTHSFRIGTATSASLAQLPDDHVQMLGRWRSNAFQQYIRPPPKQLARLSKTIVTGHHPRARTV